MPFDIYRGAARAHGMDDAAWERHANPWSVWTRVATLPLLLLAIWSRVWIGPWAWGAVVLVFLWIAVNPRLFPPPRHTDRWSSRATFGERLWLRRDELALPARHRVLPHALTAAAGLGMAVALVGALMQWFWPMLLGGLVAWLAKLWFCDRMVWLFQDMCETDPRYRDWIR